MFVVNGYQFDRREGTLHLPTRSTVVYSSPASPYVGAQILPPSSPSSKIQLKKYAAQNALAVNRNIQLATIGQIVSLIDEHGINYAQLPYRLLWFVADVRVMTADIIAAASGYLGSTSYHYTPASRLVTEWTLYPLPMDT